jgi:heme a synthase
MTYTYNRGLYRFAVFTTCWTILLFIAGALVTSDNAALSVPDWPKSFGTWFPSMRQLAGGAIFEHTHRVIAGVLGVLVLVLAILLWMNEKRKGMRWLGALAVAGVVVQAILGGEVVRDLLHYWLPVLHSCFAQLVFAAVLSVAVLTSRWWMEERPALENWGSPSIFAIAWINAIVLYLQVFLGAGFRHKDMPIWPHLIGAVLVLGTVAWTGVALRKRFEHSAELSRARVLLHSLFGLQILLGMAALWSEMATADAPHPMPLMISLTVIHMIVGTLLFGASILIVLLCYRLVPRRGMVTAASKRQATV